MNQEYRVVRFFSYWDAGTKTDVSYLRLNKTNGAFEWEDYKPRAGRFSLIEASTLMRLAPRDETHTELICDGSINPVYRIEAFLEGK